MASELAETALYSEKEPFCVVFGAKQDKNNCPQDHTRFPKKNHLTLFEMSVVSFGHSPLPPVSQIDWPNSHF
jgi:hypothetical protein